MLFCIDSDGCVFDNMRWKHEHAFLPALLETFGLEEWRDAVAPLWFEINLYSRTRGINRFAALAILLRRIWDLNDPRLRSRLQENPAGLESFLADPANRNAEALRNQFNSGYPDNTFRDAILHWHDRVNHLTESLDVALPPFEAAVPVLKELADKGDVYVVSQAPHAILKAEWEKAGLARLTTDILGQEYGSKGDQVCRIRTSRNERDLLVGDAPGDEAAAVEAQCAFFPIIPGEENRSWNRLGRIVGEDESTFQSSLVKEVDRFHDVLLANTA